MERHREGGMKGEGEWKIMGERERERVFCIE